MGVQILALVHRRIDVRRRQAHVYAHIQVHVLLSLICTHRWVDMRGLIHVRVDAGARRHVEMWVYIHRLGVHAWIDAGSTHDAAGSTGSRGWRGHQARVKVVVRTDGS